MMRPGAVYELPAKLAQPPERGYQENPPVREKRWVLIVSSERDCVDVKCTTVLGVLLSARVDLQSRFDVLIVAPEGGIKVDSIAQSDIVVTLDKRDLTGSRETRFRGIVTTDTLLRIRAHLRQRLDLL